jgi:tRNA modification GTPase
MRRRPQPRYPAFPHSRTPALSHSRTFPHHPRMPASPLPDDIIAAIATPAGRGAVALLRVSGPDAREILRRIAPGVDDVQPRVQRLAALRHPDTGELLDRGLVTYFAAPASYTGEDTLEIATHGGALTPQLVLDALLAAGARAAEPGEFTRRAYLNGKLDLLQAEAVADLIDGRSRALHRAAVHQMERGLSCRVSELRDAVIGTEALIAYSIDFPEEDEPPVPPARIVASAADVIACIDALLATAPEGELLREGALTVLAGRPNSGKSSLFNALLGTERAIVTEIPGTTRDAVEASSSIDGYPFRLVDTAGLRETADVVEGIGIEVARRYLSAADLVLFCIEADRGMDDDERAFMADIDPARLIVVRTKSDRVPVDSIDADVPDAPAVTVSAATGEGMPELHRALLSRAFGGILGEPGEAPLVTRERHARALRTARDEIAAFLAAMDDAVPMEFAATHLRAAVGALEDLVGVVSVDDVLDRVFGTFCVGK